MTSGICVADDDDEDDDDDDDDEDDNGSDNGVRQPVSDSEKCLYSGWGECNSNCTKTRSVTQQPEGMSCTATISACQVGQGSCADTSNIPEPEDTSVQGVQASGEINASHGDGSTPSTPKPVMTIPLNAGYYWWISGQFRW